MALTVANSSLPQRWEEIPRLPVLLSMACLPGSRALASSKPANYQPGLAADAEALGTVQVDELAATGLNQYATLALLLASGAQFYIGYLCWAVASPARRLRNPNQAGG
jgi:hypothetical protein